MTLLFFMRVASSLVKFAHQIEVRNFLHLLVPVRVDLSNIHPAESFGKVWM